VKVRVAYAAGLRFHQDLSRAWGRNISLLEQQRFAELLDNGDVHLTGHLGTPVFAVESTGHAAALRPSPRTASIIFVSKAAASP
jgi:hypothetical protein